MKVSIDNDDWSCRTKKSNLKALVSMFQEKLGGVEYPATIGSCMQMLYNRVHLYAESGYESYSHSWGTNDLPKEYTLKEVVELAEEVFIDCEISFTSEDILSCVSSSSTPPVVDTVYTLTIDWSVGERTETSESLEKKWNDSKERYSGRKGKNE